jgi:hypothetical protein
MSEETPPTGGHGAPQMPVSAPGAPPETEGEAAPAPTPETPPAPVGPDTARAGPPGETLSEADYAQMLKDFSLEGQLSVYQLQEAYHPGQAYIEAMGGAEVKALFDELADRGALLGSNPDLIVALGRVGQQMQTDIEQQAKFAADVVNLAASRGETVAPLPYRDIPESLFEARLGIMLDSLPTPLKGEIERLIASDERWAMAVAKPIIAQLRREEAYVHLMAERERLQGLPRLTPRPEPSPERPTAPRGSMSKDEALETIAQLRDRVRDGKLSEGEYRERFERLAPIAYREPGDKS